MVGKRRGKLALQLIACVCFLIFCHSGSQAADVTLTLGNGSGVPGSSDDSVTVSLTNQACKVGGVEVNVCDVDDYLACTVCETTERTSSFACAIEEQGSGCCKVLLFSIGGGYIEEGEGAVVTLSYDVDGDAPSGECRDLDAEEIKIRDDTMQLLEVDSVSGEFCFSTLSSTTTTITTPSIDITPDTLWKSRWVPLPDLLVIAGNETSFAWFETQLSFEPPEAVFPCFPVIWDNFYIWNLIWVMPGWLTGMEDETVTLTVTTDGEVVEGSFEIKLFPFIFNQ